MTTKPFRILVVGDGAREHALAWKFSKSPLVDQVFSLNPDKALSTVSSPLTIEATHEGILDACKRERVDFIVVGPEQPLAEGLADAARLQSIPLFGPTKSLAQLEASKAYAKEIMTAAEIPTAPYKLALTRAQCEREARDMLAQKGATVLKADALAGGKGVFVCESESQVSEALELLYSPKLVHACAKVLVEEKLEGRECSFFIFLGKRDPIPVGFAVDFKRLGDGDAGPNTGGMGAYSPVPWLPADAEHQVLQQIIQPLTRTLLTVAEPYVGCLYVGLMWSNEGPKVVEFNVRLGDPEAQILAFCDRRDWVPLIAAQLGLMELDIETREEPGKDCVVGVTLASRGYPFDHPDLSTMTTAACELGSHDGLTGVFGGAMSRTDRGFTASHGRIATVLGKASTLEEARAGAYFRLNSLTSGWEDVTYRTDIARRVANE